MSNWEEWDSCSVTCGEGSQTRVRQITNPKNHSDHCDATDDLLLLTTIETRPCNISHCPGKSHLDP